MLTGDISMKEWLPRPQIKYIRFPAYSKRFKDTVRRAWGTMAASVIVLQL